MLIKDIKLSKKDIEILIEDYNINYKQLDSKRNIILKSISSCTNKSNETLI